MVIDFKPKKENQIFNDSIYTFEEGIYGFEDHKQFAFVNQSQDTNNPFRLMMSVNTPEVSFVVVPPTFVHENYEIKIDDVELFKLGINGPQDIMVFSIVSLSEQSNDIYVNLKSPIVLSMSTRFGRQIILDNSPYQIRHILRTNS